MNDQLSFVKELISLDPNSNNVEILKLIQEYYILNRRYYIFSFWFDETRKVVNDLEQIKRGKLSKNSKLMKSILSDNYLINNSSITVKRDIIDKYNYYYTALIINDLIRKEGVKSRFKYILTILLTILSIILSFIATILSKN